MQWFDPKVSEAEERSVVVRFTGAGAADPTKNKGQGVTITWISTGLYELAFADAGIGIFESVDSPAWQATTAADLKNFSANFGDYNATTRKLRVSVYNGSGSLADLTSTQKLAFRVNFKHTSV